MTTVRMQQGRPIPWRPIRLVASWLLSLLIVGGVLGWFLWQCSNEVAALEQEIVDLNETHAVRVLELVDEITRLKSSHAEEVSKLNDEKAALEQDIAALETELADCQDQNKGLVQQADRLEAELDACLKELKQPRRVQVVFPDLLRDNTTTIFVVDDSGSMGTQITKVQEALEKAREKTVLNAQVSIMLFGDTYTTLFNFTDPAAAPWDYAIGEIKASHGYTDIDLALKAAFDSIKDEPNPNKRIVLLTDGHGFVDASTITAIQSAGIPVDTIAFGALADYALLAKIAQATDGDFEAAN